MGHAVAEVRMVPANHRDAAASVAATCRLANPPPGTGKRTSSLRVDRVGSPRSRDATVARGRPAYR